MTNRTTTNIAAAILVLSLTVLARPVWGDDPKVTPRGGTVIRAGDSTGAGHDTVSASEVDGTIHLLPPDNFNFKAFGDGGTPDNCATSVLNVILLAPVDTATEIRMSFWLIGGDNADLFPLLAYGNLTPIGAGAAGGNSGTGGVGKHWSAGLEDASGLLQIWGNGTQENDDDYVIQDNGYGDEPEYGGSIVIVFDDGSNGSSTDTYNVTLTQGGQTTWLLDESPGAGDTPGTTKTFQLGYVSGTWYATQEYSAMVVPSEALGTTSFTATAIRDEGEQQAFLGDVAGAVLADAAEAPHGIVLMAAPPAPLIAERDLPGVKVTLTQAGIAAAAGSMIAMEKKNADWTTDKFGDEGGTAISYDPIWTGTMTQSDPICCIINTTPKLVNVQLAVANCPANRRMYVKVEYNTTAPGLQSGLFGAGGVKALAVPLANPLNVASIDGTATFGNKVNNVLHAIKWIAMAADGIKPVTVHPRFEQTTFVLLSDPLDKYAGNIDGANPLPTTANLVKTAKRLDWATKTCAGADAANIEAKAAEKILDEPGFAGVYHRNPFVQLDEEDADKKKGDCTSLANLAATALRFNGRDARPARAYVQHTVLQGAPNGNRELTWGWVPKMHPDATADWHMGYGGNNFEGFFHLGEFRKWDRFPTDAYTVAPKQAIIVPVAKKPYLPIFVLNKIGASAVWRDDNSGEDEPDAYWVAGDEFPGVVFASGSWRTSDRWVARASWTGDEANDGEYDIYWDSENFTLSIHNGADVEVTGDGVYTLTCTIGGAACSVQVKVDDAISLYLCEDMVGTVRVYPTRAMAANP